ncbi:MAG: HipA family kinase [Bryobacteraceae bacterium]
MRGTAQAHLLECDDGSFYVVKFSNNPQGGRRVLDNEFVSSLLLKRLGIHTPEIAVVNLGSDFLKANPEVRFSQGSNQTAVPEIGPHFGSLHVGGPVPATVFDSLPSAMLSEVVNRGDFLGVMAFDKWVSNADGRQAVFYRARISSEMPGYPSVGWVAQFIDNGLAFQGCDWTFYDSPVQGIYRRRIVYGRRPSIRDFDPWVSAIMDIDQNVLNGVFMMLPSNWIEGHEYKFRQVLKQLCDRRESVQRLLADSLKCLQAIPAQGVPLTACCAWPET